MDSWFTYLKQGLSRKLPRDRVAGQEGYSGMKANLKNLRPFVSRHWHKGVLGFFLIIFHSLFGFPQPLITRYIVDDVILGRQLGLLAGAILLLIGISLAAFFIAIFTLGSIPKQFFPEMPPEEFWINVEMPIGSTLRATDGVVKNIESYLAKNENIVARHSKSI